MSEPVEDESWMFSVEVCPVTRFVGLNDLDTNKPLPTRRVAEADVPLPANPPLPEIAPAGMVLVKRPSDDPVRSTVSLQEPETGIVPLLSESEVLPAFAVTVPPQVFVRFGDDAI